MKPRAGRGAMIGSTVAEVLARLSEAEARFSRTQAQAELGKAQAKCAQKLQGLSRSHASSPEWASDGIAAVVRLCHEPASAADAVCALYNLSAAEANQAAIIEAGNELYLGMYDNILKKQVRHNDGYGAFRKLLNSSI